MYVDSHATYKYKTVIALNASFQSNISSYTCLLTENSRQLFEVTITCLHTLIHAATSAPPTHTTPPHSRCTLCTPLPTLQPLTR